MNAAARPRHALPALVVLGVLACAAPASAVHVAGMPHVQLTGGERAQVALCGATRAAVVAKAGDDVRAVVAPARTARARAARRGSQVVIDRCTGPGKWERARHRRLGATMRTATAALDTSHEATGDFRVQVRRRDGRKGRAAFLRVGAGEIVDVPVSFTVENQNRTPLPCLPSPDGSTVTVRGSLVAPRAVLESGTPAVTLYSHGLAYSGRFFRLQSLPGYDYGLEQARAGHASVVVDRIGYPASQGPDGMEVCYASQADAGDQLIGALRRGDYTAGGAPGTAFSKVALAGHSAGGFIAEMTQYFFGSADALAVLGYSDSGAQPPVLLALAAASAKCLTAPERAMGETGPENYAYFGETEADFRAGHVFDAEEAVVQEALAHRTRDPCGDLLSIGPSFLANQLGVRTIDTPVLLLIGSQDAFFGPPAGALQDALAYLSSPDQTFVDLPGTGHGLTLGRSHGAFRAAMDRWLTGHGF